MGYGGDEMEAACAENRKRGPAMARSGTETSISLHQRQRCTLLAGPIGYRREKLLSDGDRKSVLVAALRRIKQTGRQNRSRGRWFR